jgi:sulfhydrogenase subunit gamma (sulfur reductase)
MNKVAVNPLIAEMARVEGKVEETADTISLRLSHLNSEPLVYSPGQFNMLGFPGFGEAPFSFSSLDTGDGTFVHTIRAAGNVVSALDRLERGDQVAFRGPFGTGWPLLGARGKNLLIVAGGIGMAPLRPVVHYVLKNRDNFRDVYLLYGAKKSDNLLYEREFVRWSEGMTVLLAVEQVQSELDLPVHEGLVTKLFGFVHVSLPDTITFTCGPQVMIKFVAGLLILDGQRPKDIYVSLERRMKCGIGQCGHCQIGARYVCQDGPVFALADITRFQDTLL